MASLSVQQALAEQKRQRLVDALIAHPEYMITQLAALTDIPYATVQYYFTESFGMPGFLRRHGAQHGTEIVEQTIERYIHAPGRRSTRTLRPHQVVDTKKEPVVPVLAPLPALVLPCYASKPLAQHECQWVVSYDPPQYCQHTVAHLYCEEHDVIAKREEKARFKKALTR